MILSPLDINGDLINLAYLIVFIGIGVLVVYNRFPQYWELAFPTPQQKLESQIIILKNDNIKLTAYKKTLEAFKVEKKTHTELVTSIQSLKKELGMKD